MINKLDKKKFLEKGFCVIKIGNKRKLKKIRQKWINLINNISHETYGLKIKNDKDLIKLEKDKKKRDVFVAVFDLLHLDPDVFELASSQKILKKMKTFGLKFPHHGTRPLTRVDFPKDQKYSFFDVHQDFPYNKHSKNSIVVWIPLQNSSDKNGCLQVCPGTHIKKRIYPTKKRSKLIKNTKKFNFLQTNVKLGEALIFSEFLVHRSGKNISNKIRFSIQFRFTDLLSKEYMMRKYPVIS